MSIFGYSSDIKSISNVSQYLKSFQQVALGKGDSNFQIDRVIANPGMHQSWLKIFHAKNLMKVESSTGQLQVQILVFYALQLLAVTVTRCWVI